jgi:ABC-type glycerol-3-phosphate transport system substrate-binding protein
MVYAGGGKQDSPAAGTTVEYWNVFDPADGSGNDGKAREEKYGEYGNIHHGIKIGHNIMTYDQIREKAVVSGQAKTGPDVLHMLGEGVPDAEPSYCMRNFKFI